jgi:amidohydrolase
MIRLIIYALLAMLSFSPAVWAADMDYLMKLYRHFHQNPELSFQEEQTAARISDELKELGFEVTTGVGGHGLVGVLENGAGPTILIRTDLDGLPVVEATGLAFASTQKAIEQTGQEVGVMHACGHDTHMAAFIGTAQNLVAAKNDWSGTLVMIGQPAEERGTGARAMIVDGLFERFPRPDYNLALHVSAEHPAGTVMVVPGWAMANVDSVDIQIHGIGGHGAYPQTTKDPIVLAAGIILTLQTLVSREIAPIEPAVVTVGSIHGGAKHNVISDRVDLQLTVRSYTDEVRNALLSGIERIAHGQARAYGLPEDMLPVVTVKDEYTPAVYNTPELVQRLAPALAEVLGAANFVQGKPSLGGEDFGQYGRVEPKIPSVLFWVGGVAPSDYQDSEDGELALPSLHSAYFAPDAELTISTGIDAMTAAVLELFQHNIAYLE